MKKYLVGSLLAALAVVAPSVSNALFVSVQTDQKTAGVTLAGGSISFTATIKNLSNNNTANQITWTGVTPGATAWKTADQYIQLDSVISLSNGFIRTYTDNTAAGANPRYTGVNNSTTTPGGLVNASDTTQTLPLAWSIAGSLASAIPNGAGDPNTATSFYYWFYYTDKAQVTFNQAAVQNYNTVEAPGPAIHYAQGAGLYPDPTQYGVDASPNFMHFESNFTGALGGNTYQTSTLTIEAYTI